MPRSRPSPIGDGRTLRVGVIGRGAIGGVIADRLAAGEIDGASLAGVLRLRATGSDEVTSLGDLLDRGCDLVVEAAGHGALQRYAVDVLESGADLVVLSAGVLADKETERAVRAAGPGRLLISTGAIGGLDILRALVRTGELEAVSIRTTTTPAALAGVAGAGELIALVGDGAQPMTVFSGSAREMALRFPTLSNVAATLALATLGLDSVEAAMRLDPTGRSKRHELTAASAGGGRVHIEIENVISTSNSTTSAVTPFAVLRMLADRMQPFTAGV